MAPWDCISGTIAKCIPHAKKGAAKLSEASLRVDEYAQSRQGKKAAGGLFNCIDQCIPDMDDAEVTTFSNGCCICCVSSHHTPMEFTCLCTIL